MRFDLPDFAAFDIHILARPGAAEDYPPDVLEDAARRFVAMHDVVRQTLACNVVFGLPGAAGHFNLDDVRNHLGEYTAISEDQLRAHLIDFLSEVAPIAQDRLPYASQIP